jgi:uncharacterized membrane protein
LTSTSVFVYKDEQESRAMKRQNLLQRALACVIAFAIVQVSLQAGSPTIVFITNFTIPEPGVDTVAHGINGDGTIVGSSDLDGGETNVQGFARFRNGDYSVIIDPNEGGQGHFTVATAINNFGLIAGYYFNGHSDHSFFLSGDTYTDFALPGACHTQVTGLNDAGDFAGRVYLPGSGGCGDFHIESFVSIGGNVTYFNVPGTIVSTDANGMNNLGQVVGSYDDENGVHGFLRDADGTFTFPIDYPGAVATDLTGINDKGWMVGYYDDTEGNFHSVFLQSPTEFLVYDLGSTYFSGINNRGFICGLYYDGSLQTGFLARVRRSSDN